MPVYLVKKYVNKTQEEPPTHGKLLANCQIKNEVIRELNNEFLEINDHYNEVIRELNNDFLEINDHYNHR